LKICVQVKPPSQQPHDDQSPDQMFIRHGGSATHPGPGVNRKDPDARAGEGAQK